MSTKTPTPPPTDQPAFAARPISPPPPPKYSGCDATLKSLREARRVADDNGRILHLTEGRVTKGGQNPPLPADSPRPPAPMGSGGSPCVSVLPLESAVSFGPGPEPIDGQIIGTQITGKASAPTVRYLIAWWKGRDRSEVWLDECEVRSQSTRQSIGFKP